MFRTFTKILALSIIFSLSLSVWARPGDEPSELLARAEALYYEADFVKSVELLLKADDLLKQDPGQLKQKTDVKLQLALGLIGLNEGDRAKTYLREVYALDPDYRLDPQMFSPKVMALADEAKADQHDLRCRSLVDEAQRQSASGNGDALTKLIRSNQASCTGLTSFYSKAADLAFKEGLGNYKNAQMTEALQKFRSALVFDPKHELAAQYADLTQSKLEVTAERTLLAWRKDFNDGAFALATRDYHQLSLFANSQTMDSVRDEYRRALFARVDAWNKACANDDATEMERIRVEVNALLPEMSFAEDLLAKMKICSRVGCIQMDAQTALNRLKNRVDPQFSPFVKSQIKESPVRVLAKIRIDGKGSVTSVDLQGGHPAVYDGIRTVLDRWKFAPATTAAGPQCVDAEIAFVIRFENSGASVTLSAGASPAESPGAVRVLAYASSEKAPLYRAIMRLFMNAKERFTFHLQPAGSSGWFKMR